MYLYSTFNNNTSCQTYSNFPDSIPDSPTGKTGFFHVLKYAAFPVEQRTPPYSLYYLIISFLCDMTGFKTRFRTRFTAASTCKLSVFYYKLPYFNNNQCLKARRDLQHFRANFPMLTIFTFTFYPFIDTLNISE